MTLYLIGKDAESLIGFFIAANALFLLLAIFLDSFGLFCILLSFFPFSFGLLKFEVGIITFSPYTMGMALLSILSVYIRIAGGKRYGITRNDVLIALLCATYLTSTMLSNNITQSGFFAFHALFVPVVSYFTVKNMVQTDIQYKQALLFLMGGVVVFGVFALTASGVKGGRLLIFDMPPVSAAAIFLWLIVTMLIVGWSKSKLGLIAIAVAVVGFFRALSRGYFILILFAPLINRILKRGRAHGLMLAMLILSLLGTLVLAYTANMIDAAEINIEEDKTIERVTNIEHWIHSLAGRGYYYMDGLKQFPKNPLFGVGAYKGESGVVRHNFHVEWLEYGGLSMYLLYSIVFINHYKSMAKLARHDPFTRASLVVIFIMLVNGLTNSFTVGSTPYLTFILFGFNEARKRMYLRGEIQEPARI